MAAAPNTLDAAANLVFVRQTCTDVEAAMFATVLSVVLAVIALCTAVGYVSVRRQMSDALVLYRFSEGCQAKSAGKQYLSHSRTHGRLAMVVVGCWAFMILSRMVLPGEAPPLVACCCAVTVSLALLATIFVAQRCNEKDFSLRD